MDGSKRMTALVSPCGRYRLRLDRVTGDVGPVVAIIGVNPSTADATKNDHTIRKDMGFAKRLGWSRIIKANLCGYRATDVRDFGGVLEHPEQSRAWAAHGIDAPRGIGWHLLACGGYACVVWQSAYGHLANKATARPPIEVVWDRPVGTHQISHDVRAKRNKPVLRGTAASATPAPFRDLLLSIARSATPR